MDIRFSGLTQILHGEESTIYAYAVTEPSSFLFLSSDLAGFWNLKRK
jgi:hypothetical protein